MQMYFYQLIHLAHAYSVISQPHILHNSLKLSESQFWRSKYPTAPTQRCCYTFQLYVQMP